MDIFRHLIRYLLMACLLAGAGHALAAKSYSDNGDGTVTDPTTGLMWMRCAMGQKWDGSDCIGAAGGYNWTDANALTGTTKFAGQSDWRLPSMRELQTVVDRTGSNPATDVVAFPNTPASYFWSASALAGNSNGAWYVYFNDGFAYGYNKSYAFQVRLVRAGQSFDSFNGLQPNADYVVHADGTVTHKPTGLVWQRCAAGQVMSAGRCSGIASTYTWDKATKLTSDFAGQTDWRLPTEAELLGLVDFSLYGPAINRSAFPDTTGTFWSSSASPGNSSGNPWHIDFTSGGSSTSGKSNTYQVRFVRGAVTQDTAPVALTITKSGTGTVESSTLGGVYCGTVCTGSYTPGTVVTLSAIPADKVTWGGACTGNAATCAVTMDAAKTVTASFGGVVTPTSEPTTSTSTSTSTSTTTSTTTTTSLPVTTTSTTSTTSSTTSTTATTTSTTQIQTTGWSLYDSSTPGTPGDTLTLDNGWNLLGNGWGQALPVATIFGNAANVTTVWKWDAPKNGWQFYSPTMTAQDLQNYATSKGYGVLGEISAGEGFWVNVKQSFIVVLPIDAPVTGTDFQAGNARALRTSWNLAAVGRAQSATNFNGDLSTTPPVAGVIPLNLTTLWAWNGPQSKWYFYAPNLEAKDGGKGLTDYIATKGYLDFTTSKRDLTPGSGFWVNK